MKFWFSGEVQADVADAYRTARKEVELALNQALADKAYGPIVGWDFIAIIRETEHPDYDEVKKYDRTDSSLEFRLKIDHARFKEADDLVRCQLLLQAVLRGAREVAAIVPAGTQIGELERDILGVARARRWVD